jgi:hypothetical protein
MGVLGSAPSLLNANGLPHTFFWSLKLLAKPAPKFSAYLPMLGAGILDRRTKPESLKNSG